jgi:hypothetical protein
VSGCDSETKQPTDAPRDSVICDESRWCWEEPVPRGNLLLDAWAAGPNDIWAVGDYGTVLRWNGAEWSPVPDPTRAIPENIRLKRIHGSSADNVWVISTDYEDPNECMFFHWNGSSWERWTPEKTGVSIHPTALWVDGPDDVWVAGRKGSGDSEVPFKVVHFNGMQWEDRSNVDSPDDKIDWIEAFWRDGNGTLWAGGYGPVYSLFEWNGAWVAGMAQTPDVFVTAIWGIGNEAWASGNQALHFINGTWRKAPYEDLQLTLDVWGSSPTDVWFLSRDLGDNERYVIHLDGTYQELTASAIVGTSASEAWAVDLGGVMWRLDGKEWKNNGTSRLLDHDYRVAWAADSTHVWVGGEATRFWNGQDWSDIDLFRSDYGLEAIHGSAANDVWAVSGGGTIAHYDGKKWQHSYSADSWVNAIWAVAPDDVWAVGSDILHWNGNSWDTELRVEWNLTPFYDVWAGAGADVLVTDGSFLGRREGSQWRSAYDPALGEESEVRYRALGGSPAHEPWLLTTTGLFRRRDGAWQRIQGPGDDEFLQYANYGGDAQVVPDTADSAWIVLSRTDPKKLADGEAVFRWDGTTMRRVIPPGRVRAITSAGAEHAWAVGPENTILRYRP